MRINNNLMAMNTHRQMTATGIQQAKSMERLSSGYRINRAGDDAAGLAISEKMRSQIRGLNQASRNSQDAISLVQTAEGALSETQSILQRMRELAVQAGNDTNVDKDRDAIQNEIEELTNEINRIAENSEFNTRKLLNGNAALETTVTDSAGNKLAEGQGVTVKGASSTLKAGEVIDMTGVKAATKASFKVTASGVGEDIKVGSDTALKINGVTVNLTAGTTGTDIVDAINAVSDQTGVVASYKEGSAIKNELILTTEGVGSDAKVEVSGVKMSADGAAADTFTDGGAGTTGLVVATSDGTTDTVVSAADAAMAATVVAENTGADATGTVAGSVVTAKGNEITVHGGDADGLVVEVDKTKTSGDVKITVDSNNSLNMQIGANEGQELTLSLNDMRANALGVENVDISTSKSAKKAITTISNAINMVSSERAKLGAVQNRLEHTIANLNTSAENLQASESRIRDVDMAKEMMNMTKTNILQQAAQAMLAQANQSPKGVLQLLKG